MEKLPPQRCVFFPRHVEFLSFITLGPKAFMKDDTCMVVLERVNLDTFRGHQTPSCGLPKHDFDFRSGGFWILSKQFTQRYQVLQTN